MHIFLGSVAKELFPRLCEEYLAGRLNLYKLITHTMSLDEINMAFDVIRAGERYVKLSVYKYLTFWNRILSMVNT